MLISWVPLQRDHVPFPSIPGERNLSATISLRPGKCPHKCSDSSQSLNALPLLPPLSEVPLSDFKKANAPEKPHGHCRRCHSSVSRGETAYNRLNRDGRDGNDVCPTVSGRWLEKVRALTAELTSPTSLMASTGFTSAIFRASMTLSRKNIKVHPCITKAPIWPSGLLFNSEMSHPLLFYEMATSSRGLQTSLCIP